jgi:hypothetical protein
MNGAIYISVFIDIEVLRIEFTKCEFYLLT